MKAAIDRVELTAAEQTFAVANTPSFLVRKLRDDQAVRRLALDFPPEKIIAGLKRNLKRQPKTLGDIVRPYALVVALSWLSNSKSLRDAASLSAPYHPWFSEITADLLKRHSPVNYVTLEVNRRPSVQAWSVVK